jgi:hypothetical protein
MHAAGEAGEVMYTSRVLGREGPRGGAVGAPLPLGIGVHAVTAASWGIPIQKNSPST